MTYEQWLDTLAEMDSDELMDTIGIDSRRLVELLSSPEPDFLYDKWQELINNGDI